MRTTVRFVMFHAASGKKETSSPDNLLSGSAVGGQEAA